MKTKFYLLPAKGKVKEISFKKWRDIMWSDIGSVTYTHLICKVTDTKVYIRKGKQSMIISKNQLKQVLVDSENE